jgi:hypothetical protein
MARVQRSGRAIWIHSFLSLLAMPALAQVSPPPPNDECGSAIPIGAGSHGPFTNVGATTNPLDPAWPCANGGREVWFVFESRCNQVVTLDTCRSSTFDTAIHVLSGSCGALAHLACNDDFCNLSSRCRRTRALLARCSGELRSLFHGGHLGMWPSNARCLRLAVPREQRSLPDEQCRRRALDVVRDVSLLGAPLPSRRMPPRHDV